MTLLIWLNEIGAGNRRAVELGMNVERGGGILK